MIDLLEGLNDKQREAVLKTEGPLLILAGAGSGKTRVITSRIAYMIREKGVLPWQVLAITFTNKAAAEMRERQEQMLGRELNGAWICTFHSCCVRILRMHAEKLGYDSNFTIYDGDDQKTVIKNICRKFDIDTKRFKEKWFLGQISSAKDELKDAAAFERDAAGDYYLDKVAKVYREYEAELKKNNAFDFDDLIVKTVELFRKFPDVLEQFQERFRYISIDEYQDTNTAQFVFAGLLARKYRNICVVGDDDQSIYKFRGANIGNILNFEKVFPDAQVIRLEQNYRSSGRILKAANAVISNNVNRKSKTLWTDAPEGEKIRLFYVDNPYVEADRVIAVIRKYLHEGYHLNSCACLYRTNAQSRALEEAFVRANIPYKIVGGVNFYQRKEIKDVLAYLKTVDNGQDDMAVQRIINVPKRGIGAAAINMVQHFADERGISFYGALDTGITEGVFGKAGDKLRPFRDLIEVLKKSAQDSSVTELIDEVLDKSGYRKDLENEQTVESQTRLENIEELVNKAAAYEANFTVRGVYTQDSAGAVTQDGSEPAREGVFGSGQDGRSGMNNMGIPVNGQSDDHDGMNGSGENGQDEQGVYRDEFLTIQDRPTLGGFLEEVSLVADIDSWDGRDDYVSLITIHSAKGLEFDNVFLCGMEDGLFPMAAAINSADDTDLEEERRLAYVGITRAKKHLILTASKTRMVRGETMVSQLSRFVREIPPLLLENDRDNIYVKTRPSAGQEERNSTNVKTGSAASRDDSGRRSSVVLNEKPYALRKPAGYGSARDVSVLGGQYSGGQCSGEQISRFGKNTPSGYSRTDKGSKPGKALQQTGSGAKAGLGYKEGDRVDHIKFGEGTVLSIIDGGKDYEVTVDFEDFGVKKMFAAFAKLQKI